MQKSNLKPSADTLAILAKANANVKAKANLAKANRTASNAVKSADKTPSIANKAKAKTAIANLQAASNAAKAAKADNPKPAPKRNAKPKAKPIAASKPKADKQADAQALTVRIQAEQKTAFELFTKLSASESIPIKPLSAFAKSYKRNVPSNPIGSGKPTPRRAAAIFIAALASGIKCENGNKFPRKFTMRGVQYCLDNGAARRCHEAGLARYSATSETFTIINAPEILGQIKTAGFKL